MTRSSIWRSLSLGRAMPDRAAHRRLDADWLADAWKRARVLVIDERGRVLVDGPRDAPTLVWVAGDEAPEGDRFFLADEEDVPYFAVVGTLREAPAGYGEGWPTAALDQIPDGLRTARLRDVGAVLPPIESALLAQTVGVVNWRAVHRFGPRTGRPLRLRAGGWEAETEDGDDIVYPRTDPAVIVLVHDDVPGDEGRCLLARQATWDVGRYSCVAGFVEPGEAAEAAVHREVFEETGIRLDDVQYVASQAWPLPASLMLGFYALADPTQTIVVDGVELAEGHWFTRAQLKGRGPEPHPIIPPSISIAHELLTGWRDERH